MLILTILFTLCSISFFACDEGETPPQTNYNEDVEIVAPENIDVEHFVTEQGKTYYTSRGFSLWMEVNGEFLEMDYFTLDGNKRVYNNLYLYSGDYFYMVTDDLKDLYASLDSSVNVEYAEEEKQSGEDVQVNVKKSGVYKLTFDVDTLKFGMEYLSAIETPVYYTIKNCSIYSVATSWREMGVNPTNPDEFVMTYFDIEAGKIISFFNNIHTSNYKVTLDSSCDGKLASVRKTQVTVNVGGTYTVYINAKTYVVRLVLLNPDTASYSCVYYDGSEFIELSPVESSVPYVFKMQFVADSDLTSVPDFHTENYRTYALTPVGDVFYVSSKNYCYFKKAGTYDIEINLKTFEITARTVTQ